MRVIGGEFRSRPLKSLPGLDVRPTPDRLRESLFNVLATRIAGTVFADAYAGTGAVGIEALSRGASRAVFIEQSRSAVRVIREIVRIRELIGMDELVRKLEPARAVLRFLAVAPGIARAQGRDGQHPLAQRAVRGVGKVGGVDTARVGHDKRGELPQLMAQLLFFGF